MRVRSCRATGSLWALCAFALPAVAGTAGAQEMPTLPQAAPPVPPRGSSTRPAPMHPDRAPALPGEFAPPSTALPGSNPLTGGPPRPYNFDFQAGTRLTYTDNVDLAARGLEESALVWTNFVSMQAIAQGARVKGALDYTLAADLATAGRARRFLLRHDLRALADYAVVPNLAFIEGEASVARLPLATGAPVSLDPVAGRNDQAHLVTIGISPYLTPRFGDWGSGELRYQYRRALTGAPGTQEPTSHLARALLQAGKRSAPARFSLLGEAERVFASGNASLQRDTTEGRAEYRALTDLSLLGMAGYEKLRAGSLTERFDGPIGSVGAKWQPSIRTSLEGSYGRRYGGDVLDVTASYRPTLRTVFSASYVQRLYAGFEALAGDALSLDPLTGGFLARSLQQRNPSLGFGLQDLAYHAKRANLSVAHQFERNFLELGASYEIRSYELQPNQKLTTFTADFIRQLSRRTEAILRAIYRHGHESGASATRDTVGGRAELKYRLTTDLDAGLGYSHTHRFADVRQDRYRENAVFVELTYRF